MHNKSLPLVSIIIPSYNTSDYLKKMIECVLEQSYSNWELIIVDDQSTDNSIEIIQKFIHLDHRIKLISRDRAPKGAQTCRNIGLLNAIGHYVVFFDSDDLIATYCLEQRVNFMETNSNIDFGVFQAQSFSNAEHFNSLSKSNSTYGKNKNTDVFSDFLKADYPFTVWTNIFKTESIKNYLWDEKVRVYQDFDYLLRILMNGLIYKFSDSKEIDYYYRINTENKSVSSNFTSSEKNESTIYLFSKTLNSLEKREDYNKRKKEFLHFIVLHFERLVMDGETAKAEDYLSFCGKYYKRNIAKSLGLICYISSNITNLKIRKGILYLLIALRFGYYKYIKFLLKQICVL